MLWLMEIIFMLLVTMVMMAPKFASFSNAMI